jgi:predicted transposase/invertase (TIGR01784 family)
VVFKKVFGQNKDLLKSFLNSLLPLPDDGLIETIVYLPSEQVPRTPLKKFSIVDVRCTDQHGRAFIVEMQMGWSEAFKQRLQFGTSKAYVEQLNKGEDYKLLQPVYGLGLLGESFAKKTDEWYHHYKVVNVKDTEDQIKGLELIFVELPKFKPTTYWEKRLGVLWLRFLNEISQMNEIPQEFMDVPELQKAIELTQEATFTPQELAEYDGYWDLVSMEKTIKSDAKAEGIAEGVEKGIKIGKAEGETQKARVVARTMLKKRIDEATILECSGLTIDELSALKQSLDTL